MSTTEFKSESDEPNRQHIRQSQNCPKKAKKQNKKCNERVFMRCDERQQQLDQLKDVLFVSCCCFRNTHRYLYETYEYIVCGLFIYL